MTKVLLKTNQNNPAIKAYVSAIEKGKKNEHVMFREDHWVVKRILDKKAGKIFRTKEEAKAHAILLGRQNKTSVFIYNREGGIQERLDF